MGLLDRVIGVAERIAPRWGLERARARAASEMLNHGYSHHGASRIKKSMAGWTTTPGGPDVDIIENLPLLRERSRDLCMGEGLAGGALKTIRTNEIGPGLRLNAKIDQEFLGLSDEEALAWEANTEREFSLWANNKSCDAARRCDFGELQALARFSQLASGDVFALLPVIPRKGDRYDLRIHLLEADRVSNPYQLPALKDILGGVEVGPLGEVLAYHIADRHPYDYPISGGLRILKLPTWTRIPAFGSETGRALVLHLMDVERPGQRRGIPILAPVIEHLKQLSRYSQAEIMAAVVSGMFTAAITSERPDAKPGAVVPPHQQVHEREDEKDITYQLAPGAILGLLPGEKLESVNPARPNPGFEPFFRAVCQQIGAGLGLPYELVIKQFTASYSASRAALLEAWKVFTVGRERMKSQFCQPAYEQWLEEAVLRGYVQAPGFFSDPATRAAWCGAEWHGPTQGQLDPTKEVEAASLRVAAGFSTRTRETAEITGGNFEQFNKIRGREERIRREEGVADATPEPATTPAVPPAEEVAA